MGDWLVGPTPNCGEGADWGLGRLGVGAIGDWGEADWSPQ